VHIADQHVSPVRGVALDHAGDRRADGEVLDERQEGEQVVGGLGRRLTTVIRLGLFGLGLLGLDLFDLGHFRLGSRLEPGITAPGGADVGTGIGAFAEIDGSSAAGFCPRRRPGDFSTIFCSLTERRLTGPRTGTRFTQTQPTCGTGLPPMRRPSSNNHAYSPWNSW